MTPPFVLVHNQTNHLYKHYKFRDNDWDTQPCRECVCLVRPITDRIHGGRWWKDPEDPKHRSVESLWMSEEDFRPDIIVVRPRRLSRHVRSFLSRVRPDL